MPVHAPQEVPELASLLNTATDAGPPNRAAAAASAQAAAAAEAKLRAAPSGLPGLSANRDTRAARIFKAEERTEQDELVRPMVSFVNTSFRTCHSFR